MFYDVETESDVDLTVTGAHAYAVDPSTQLVDIGWINGAAGQVDQPPALQEFKAALEAAEIAWAFNAEFDLAVTSAAGLMGFDELLAKTSCFQHRAWAAGIRPARTNLKTILELTKAPADIAKREDVLAASGYSWGKKKAPEPAPDAPKMTEREARDIYVLGDVEALQWLDKALPPLTPFQTTSWRSAARINANGMPVDRKLAEACVAIGKRLSDRAKDRFRETTGLNATQREKARLWFGDQGLKLPNMRGETLQAIETSDLDPAVRDALVDYQAVGLKPYQKFETILGRLGSDDRLRGCFKHEAAHTGRSAGIVVNLQNLKRPDIGRDEQIALAETVRAGNVDLDLVEMVFGDAVAAITQLQRSVFAAPDGAMLADGDFSKAEPMAGYFLTGEKDPDDPYHVVAATVLNGLRASLGKDKFARHKLVVDARVNPDKPVDFDVADINKDTELYQIGKAGWLGAGYGQSGAGLRASLAAKGIAIDAAVSASVTDACRSLKPQTFGLGLDVLEALAQAAGGKRTILADGKLIVQKYQSPGVRGVEIILPSGRPIRYRYLRATRSNWGGRNRLELTYWPAQAKTSTGKPLAKSIHVGVVLENLLSGIARDFLWDAVNGAISEGIEVVAEVHDQIVAVVRHDHEARTLEKWMNKAPDWADGFAMSADVELVKRLTK